MRLCCQNATNGVTWKMCVWGGGGLIWVPVVLLTMGKHGSQDLWSEGLTDNSALSKNKNNRLFGRFLKILLGDKNFQKLL